MSNSPTPIHSATAHALSVVGRVRDHNEDSVIARQWSANTPGPCDVEALLAVADGMGGHERGEWASSTALSVLDSHLATDADSGRLDAVLSRAFSQINETVYGGSPDIGQAHPGTTLTVSVVRGNTCTIGHVGDSRLYLYRAGLLTQVTEDHSWAAELVRWGEMTPEQAANWAHKNQITRAVGVRQSVEPAIYELELQSRDVLLLCSDGLSGMLSDEQITSAIASSSSAVQAGETLCAAANEAGGEDNISVVLYSHGTWPTPTRQAHIAKSESSCASRSAATTRRTWTSLRMVLAALAIVALAVIGLWLVVHGGRRTPVPEEAMRRPGLASKLQITVDGKLETLHVRTRGATVRGIALTKEPRWDAARTTYRFDGKAMSSLRNGSATIELRGLKRTKLTLDNDLAWKTSVSQSSAYQLYWIENGEREIAAFRVVLDGPKRGAALDHSGE